MTYLQILLVFVLIPCVLLAPAGLRALSAMGRRGKLALPAVALIAFAYTTPWDNYLIWKGVWDSPADRILGRIGYVPVEEYLFFLLQPLLTGLWFGVVAQGVFRTSRARGPEATGTGQVRAVGVGLGLAASVAGWRLLSGDPTFYLGAILVWTGPVLAGLWWLMGPELWRIKGRLAWAVAVPTVYLWVVDHMALASGVWALSERYTTGIAPLGLPVEEALFFLATNVMVVLGIASIVIPQTSAARREPARRGGWIRVAPVLLAVQLTASCGAPPPDTLGLVDGGLHSCPTPSNCVRSGAPEAAAPFQLRQDADEGWSRAVGVVRSMPRTRVVTETDGYLHAEVTSLVFRFVDDLELLMDPQTGSIQYRSASRVGRSDMGVNRERIARLRDELAGLGLISPDVARP